MNKYVIVRTESNGAGCFAGYVQEQNGNTIKLSQSRRLRRREGAMTLSQLSIDGTNKPEGCKFPAPIENHIIFLVAEIIECTEKARKSIESVPHRTI